MENYTYIDIGKGQYRMAMEKRLRILAEPPLHDRLDGIAEGVKVHRLLDVCSSSQLEAASSLPLFWCTTEDDNGGRLIVGKLAYLRQQHGAIHLRQFEVEQDERGGRRVRPERRDFTQEHERFHAIGHDPESKIVPVIGHDPLDDIDIRRVVFDEEHVGGRLPLHTLPSFLSVSIEECAPDGSPRKNWVTAYGGLIPALRTSYSTERDLPGRMLTQPSPLLYLRRTLMKSKFVRSGRTPISITETEFVSCRNHLPAPPQLMFSENGQIIHGIVTLLQWIQL
jgi:hypothetical protein